MKGQTAVEYLMTYGWAILIILIVAGVLAYYGIFQPQGFLGPTARGFGQVQVLNPWALTSGNVITMNVQNQVGGTITPTDINVTITGSGGGNCASSVTSTPANIDSGSQGVITCTISGLTGLTTGEPYSASVTISYEYPVGGSTFTSTGTLSGTIG
ncbi:hypothetical protein A3K64_02170 [Candidatus Micrarchaeota archaeon RBG_16_36_9]|nr:MAG: hypothetical protein A3K64_02170 [Candidatus Micrarchaeota archaeon RBG_16_36_9]